METYLPYIAVMLAILGEGIYIHSIIKRKSRPSFIGWLIFTVEMSLVFASAYTLGAHDTLPLLGTFIVMHSITTVLSLKYGFVHFTKLNILSLILLVLGALLWWETHNAWYALIIFTTLDALGYLVIIRKLNAHPKTEYTTAWLLSFVAYAVNLMGIHTWVPQEYLFSLSNVILSGFVIFLSLRPRNSMVRRIIRELPRI